MTVIQNLTKALKDYNKKLGETKIVEVKQNFNIYLLNIRICFYALNWQ